MSGLLGVGGGFIMVPAMVYLLGLSQHEAHGTSLAAMTLIVLLSAVSYSTHGYMDWTVALELAVGGVLGAMIGARIANRLSGHHLRRYFGLLLVVIAGKMLWDVVSFYSGGAAVNGHSAQVHQLNAILVFGVGVLTGTLSGLMGVGGGIIMVPALIYLMGMSQRMAQGISLAVIIPVSISGALIHSKHGNVRSDIWFWLAMGGVGGGLIGAWLAVHLPAHILRAVFSVLMVVLGTLMVTGRKQARQTIDNAEGG